MEQCFEARGPFFRTAVMLSAALVFFLAAAVQAQASHVSCGQTITQDTTLDSDVTDCPEVGVAIGAGNITLDLKGHTIAGVGFSTVAGVSNTGFDGVVVKGGTVRDFRTGVLITDASGNQVSN